MLIQEMTRPECFNLLARSRLGRLGCAWEGQPYITPLYFAQQGDRLYSFSTIGQKIEWMRRNPLVCVEADEVHAPQKWFTVIAFGRYEELTKTPDYEDDRQLAYSLLQQRPQWWQPGYVKTILHGKERELEPIYFCIHITKISGHLASPEN